MDDFGAAYQAHYDGMIRLAYVITDSMAAAEDIVQEAFVELYRRWPTVRDPERWLHTVVVNRSRSWWRRLLVARRHVARGSPIEVTPSAEDGTAVRQALLALSRRQRAAVFLRFYLDAAAVAVVVCGTVTAVATTRTEVDRGLAPVFSPDRIADFASLPGPEVVWPHAVHKLPLKLPDDSAYRIADTTGGDDLLVVSAGRETGPLLFNPDTGSVRGVATASVSDGLAAPKVSTALVAGDRVVWFVSGRRQGRVVREAWQAPLAGGDATKLADLPPSAVDGRGALAGDAVIWEQYGPGQGQDDVIIKRLSLRDGRVDDVPGSRGYWLSTVPGWITSQYGGTPFGEPERTGTLVEVATGRQAHWTANDEMASTVACGPEWCTGGNVAADAAIQNIDGSGYVDLGQQGSLSPRLEGRLATGDLDNRYIVWDRGSGRAAAIQPPPPPHDDGIPVDPGRVGFDRDNEASVYAWHASDGSLLMLDLKRLW